MTDDDVSQTSGSSSRSDEDLARAVRAALTPVPTSPPPDRVRELRARVERGRDGVADQTTTRGRRSHRAGGVSRRRALTAAAGVALLAAGGAIGAAVGSVARDQDDLLARGTDEFVATLVGDGVEVSVEGASAPEGRIITLRSPSLPVLPEGDYYELWFVDTDGNRISAGTFHPDEQGRTLVVLHAAVDPRLAGEMEITREPGDGDPAPSGDVVARGSAELG